MSPVEIHSSPNNIIGLAIVFYPPPIPIENLVEIENQKKFISHLQINYQNTIVENPKSNKIIGKVGKVISFLDVKIENSGKFPIYLKRLSFAPEGISFDMNINVKEEYPLELTEEKVNEFSQTMNDCKNYLVEKLNTFKELSINPYREIIEIPFIRLSIINQNISNRIFSSFEKQANYLKEHMIPVSNVFKNILIPELRFLWTVKPETTEQINENIVYLNTISAMREISILPEDMEKGKIQITLRSFPVDKLLDFISSLEEESQS